MVTATRMAYVALLRAINVGGNNKVPMAELRDCATALGYTDVVTYVQSGNIVFTGARAPNAAVERRLEAAIAARFGFDVPVVVRTLAEMRAVAGAHPMAAEGIPNSQTHVIFLGTAPTAAAVASIAPDRSPPDRLLVRGSEVYAYLPNGAATKYTTAYLEKCLGTRATARNWNTVTRLVELLEVAAASGA